jgi:uncharacterized protein YfiM (DUF2279 family)
LFEAQALKKLFLIPVLCLFIQESFGQSFFEPADSLNKKRAIGVSAVNTSLWAGTIISLNYVWYQDFEKSKFHTFNDGHEWLQMDKVGHALTSWNFARVAGGLYEWSGVEHKKAALIGTAFSVGYMTTFEFLDAYNVDWGFSWYDIGANTAGSLLYFGQEYFWNDQKFKLKFSFHNSGLAQHRPNVLGSDFPSRTLKDYNGQTYWLSFNPISSFKTDSKIPKWINLSLGYSVNDQLIGDGGTYIIQQANGDQLTFEPYRQWFLSFDIDFEKIPVKSKALKVLFRTINIVKVPFPALELSRGKLKLNPLYF